MASTPASTGCSNAVVARPPVFGGKVKSFDEAAAMKVPGVVKVVTIDPPAPPYEFMPTGGVAVIARNTWAAIKGREALNRPSRTGRTRVTIPTPTGPPWNRPCASPARWCARKATSTRR